jgi:hypothetical protein
MKSEAATAQVMFDICHDQWLRKGRAEEVKSVNLANNLVRVPENMRENFCGGSTRKTITLWDRSVTAGANSLLPDVPNTTPSPNASGNFAYFFPDENGQCRAEAVADISAIDTRFSAGNTIRYSKKVNWRAKASDFILNFVDTANGWYWQSNGVMVNAGITQGDFLKDGEFAYGDNLPVIGNASGVSYEIRASEWYKKGEDDEEVKEPFYLYTDSENREIPLTVKKEQSYEIEIEETAQLDFTRARFVKIEGGQWQVWRLTSSGEPNGLLYTLTPRTNIFGLDRDYYFLAFSPNNSNAATPSRIFVFSRVGSMVIFRYMRWTTVGDNRYETYRSAVASVNRSVGGVIDDSLFKRYEYDGYNNLGIEELIGSDDIDFDNYDNNYLYSLDLTPTYNAIKHYAEDGSGFIDKETREEIVQTKIDKVDITLEKGEYLLYCFAPSGESAILGVSDGNVGWNEGQSSSNSIIYDAIGVITNWRVAILQKAQITHTGEAAYDPNVVTAKWLLHTVYCWDALGGGLNERVWFCRYWVRLMGVDVSDDPPSSSWWSSFLCIIIVAVVVALAIYSGQYWAVEMATAGLTAYGVFAAVALGATIYNFTQSTLPMISTILNGAPSMLAEPTYETLNSQTTIGYNYQAAVNPYDSLLDLQSLVSV